MKIIFRKCNLIVLPLMLMLSSMGFSKTFVDALPVTEKIYSLKLVTSELKNPIGMQVAPGDKSRLYVFTQPGRIAVIKNGKVTGTFLDLRNGSTGSHIVSNFAKTGFAPFDERGLLGLAFHPDFASNGKFYVYYSADNTKKLKMHTGTVADHITRISEFTIKDRDNANKNSEKVILEFLQPMWNHNGGKIAFSPKDGYLYIASGDGGGADDNDEGHTGGKGGPFSKGRPGGVLGNSQDATNLLGNILRIDVNNASSGRNYTIPDDNPFVGKANLREEIYHMGLRNPWRMSFDKKGQLYIADVGQNKYEMVWTPKKASNMGWRMFEAGQVFDLDSIVKYANSSPLPLLLHPTTIYAHPKVKGGIPRVGLSITGGFVYEGNDHPELKGKYVFADWSSTFMNKGNGRIMMLHDDGAIVKLKMKENGKLVNTVNGYIQGVDLDSKGELYFFIAPVNKDLSNKKKPVFDPFKGKVYKLVSGS